MVHFGLTGQNVILKFRISIYKCLTHMFPLVLSKQGVYVKKGLIYDMEKTCPFRASEDKW
jgi:hypothetical protein